MGLIVKDTGGGDFTPTPAGTHAARCYMVVDLGIQQTNFGEKHKILIGWELPNESMDDGRPYVISNHYTASLSDKAILRQHLESWRGRRFTDQELTGFDVFNVLGAPCMLSVIHNLKGDKTYANVSSVSSLPKGMEVPEAVNMPVKLSLDEFDQGAFESLPEWIQKKINVRGVGAQESGQDNPPVEAYDFDDSIQF